MAALPGHLLASRRFDAGLATEAKRTQELRIGADYEARQVDVHEAASVVELAGQFVAAIEALYSD